MPLINEADAKKLKEVFSDLPQEVKLVFFSQENECSFCATTRQLLEELSSLSEKLTLQVYDFVKDQEQVVKYKIDKIPATALIGQEDYGVRFYGIPAGYEFTVLVEDIVNIGRGGPQLEDDVLAELQKIDKAVHLQVAISPTCPYCTQAVRAAHRLAMSSEHIRADMIEVSEFPHLAVKYGVKGVPHTVINEQQSLVGAPTEKDLLLAIQKAIET